MPEHQRHGEKVYRHLASSKFDRGLQCRSKSDKLLGKPKKHGAGGKYNWGGTLDAEAVSGVQDPCDPNYDSGTEDLNGAYIREAPFTKSSEPKQLVRMISQTACPKLCCIDHTEIQHII